jgi:hypothetical protein
VKAIERVQMWLWTLVIFGLAVVVVQSALVTFRETQLDAQEAAKDKPAATEPKLSDGAHARIRDLQLQQKTIENQYLQMQQQIVNLEKQFNGLTSQLSEATDAAYKEAHVTREEYSLDMSTLKFAKVEKPKPEEKKPEAKKP